MRIRTLFIRISMGIALLIAALAMTGPEVTRAAGATILVDYSNPATDCGSYTGKPASTDPADAITNAPSGSTIVICPLEFSMPGTSPLAITNKKLTIRRAVPTGMDNAPKLNVNNSSGAGIAITDSTVTIDGLLIYAGFNTQSDFAGIRITRSSATLKNIMVVGSAIDGSDAIEISQLNQPKMLPISISSCYLAGFRGVGVYVDGPAKVTISGCTIDGTDGGRVSGPQGGILITGWANNNLSPTGTIKNNTIFNVSSGINLGNVSNVTVASNIIVGAIYDGIKVETSSGATHNSDNIKLISNTILGIRPNGFGIRVSYAGPPSGTIRNLTISKNTLAAGPFLDFSTWGLYLQVNVPAQTEVTVIATNNKFTGLVPANRIYNNGNNSTVTSKGNLTAP